MAGTATPNFGVRQVHQSVPLTQLSVGYHPTGLIAESVFPVFKVKNENDVYYVWDKGQAFRVDRTDGYSSIRPDKARPHQLNFGATLASYVAEEFALETLVSDRELANQDSALNLQVSKVRRVQDLILLDQEIRVATIVRATGNNSGSVTNSGATQWNNASFASLTTAQHSAIKAQIETGKESIRTATGGLLPNVIVIPREVAAVMFNDAGLADLVKFNTSPASDLLTGDFLNNNGGLWGMKVLIPTGMYTSVIEGEAFSSTSIWGKDVWMGYVSPNPGLDALSYGMIFRSREWQVKTYRDEFTDTTVYRPSIVQAEKLITKDCGYIIKAAIA